VTLPWSKFFWSDYASDPALKLCSFAAQGLWMRMLCLAAEHEPAGYVAVNGRGLEPQDIARITGGAFDEVCELIGELERNGVFSRDRRGWIYSRRMKNEVKKRDIASQNGKKGGNPSLTKQREYPEPDKQQDKLTLNGQVKPQKPEARDQIEESSSYEDVSVGTDPPLSEHEVLEAWAERMVPLGFPRVEKMTASRRRQLRARIRDSSVDEWQRAMDALERSAFCRGENDRGWRADFDFLLQPKSFTKLLEGAYDH
jgi:hypothetical protein